MGTLMLLGAGVPVSALAQTVVYQETFENNTGANTVVLTDYTAAVPFGGSPYTASTWWLNTFQCNGLILQYASPVFSGTQCDGGNSDNDRNTAKNNVRRMADVLGQLNAGVVGGATDDAPVDGSTAATRRNHAVAEWTSLTGGGGNEIAFDSSPVSLGSTTNRFYSARIDVAEASCTYRSGARNSQLNLFIVSGGTEIPINSTPLRVCTDPVTRTYTSPFSGDGDLLPVSGTNPYGTGGVSVRAGRVFSNAAVKLPSSAGNIGFRVRSLLGLSDGNDFAIDNPTLVDVTPSMSKTFAPATAQPGDIATITFTVTNTTDNLAKPGWQFTDNLSAGLTLASTTLGGTCTDYTDTAGTTATLLAPAAVGNTAFTVRGSLPAVGSCTVIVQVQVAATASTPTLQNCGSNISNPDYIIPPAAGTCATLGVTRPVTLTKLWQNAAANDSVSLTIAGASVSNAVVGSSTAPSTTTNATAQAASGSTVTLTEAFNVGSAGNYTTALTCRKTTDSSAITVSQTGLSGTFVMPADSAVTCTFNNARTLQADVSIAKTNTIDSGPGDVANDAVVSGANTTYTLTVTNNGPDAVTGVVVTDQPLTNLTCPGAGNPDTVTCNGPACTGATPLTISGLTSSGITLGALPNGQSTTLTFTCRVN